MTKQTSPYLIISALVILVLAYLYWTKTSQLDASSKEIVKLREEIAHEKLEKEGLLEKTDDQEQQLSFLASELEKITGTVDILEKLQNTDEELLQKYSKVYFLNEHYVPSSFKTIPEEYLANKLEEEKVHYKVWPYLKDLLESASEDSIELRVVSAYRSFREQSELKEGYRVLYGSGANAFSADQGYSEHQLGSTIDFSTDSRGTILDGFETTEAYTWLKDNAHRYGFILSYPEGNTYYIFEPWHWRFVGVELAKDLHNKNESFYDWEQRKIDEYIIMLFD